MDEKIIEELNKLTDKEKEKLLNKIASNINEIDELDLKIQEVEKALNFKFPDDYKNYLLRLMSLKMERCIFEISANKNKIINTLFGMDKDDKNYILNNQQFDSRFENVLIPFASLEFGDMLCFNRETNKIVIYNHEEDKFDEVTRNFNELQDKLFTEQEIDDLCEIRNRLTKTNYGYSYNESNIDIMIDTDNLPTVDVINYSIKLAKYCNNHMSEINDYIYEKLRKRGGYIDDLTKDDFIKKIGKPIIYDEYLNFGSLSYLENTIDEHIITLEFNGFDLGYVSLNG